MSKYISILKTDTLCLSRGKDGYWLYDNTRGMNLAMQQISEQSAFMEALEYYQERLLKVEEEQRILKARVSNFIGQFVADFEEGDL